MNEPANSSPPFAELSRPFFFMVPFWGERYRRYFVDRLLPSLLAPNNLPLLRAFQGHRFLIATTPEDWAAFIDLPIMKRLREYATPTLIEISQPDNHTAAGSGDAYLHQNVVQKLLVIAAFQSKAYGCLLCPDFIISDGMVASLIRHAQAGHHLVLCPALRQTEESAISELTSRGYLPRESTPAETGMPIIVPPRALSDIMVRCLHPEMAIFEEGAPGQPPLAPFRYWRLPDHSGMILHTFQGIPVLMDYGVVQHHDIACLEHNWLEVVYVARNFGNKGEFHVVQDSDEFCIMSLTPATTRQMTTNATFSAVLRPHGGFIRRLLVALSISYHTAGMPLKKQLFAHSLRWHAGDLDDAGLGRERRISAFVDSAVQYSRFTQVPATLLLSFCNTPAFRWSLPYGSALVKALLGDRYIWSAIRQRLSFQMQRPFKRALFWLASGRDLDVFDPGHLSYRRTIGRRVVGDAMFSANPTTAVILGVGQSNIANEGDPSALYEPRGEVYNFNFLDGKCYAARDPLLGASVNRSNVLTRVGDLLIERGNYSRVLLVPIAHGGTYAHEWAPEGRMFPRLEWTIERLRERQIMVTHVLHQQGESEAAQSTPHAQEWTHHVRAMVEAIRAAGVGAPIYIAQCTICRNEPNETIRSAQRQVVDPAAGILPGPDLDLVRRDERYDGCHFSTAGMRHAAELWCDALCRTK